MVEEIFFFALRLGNVVDGEVLKVVHARFSRGGNINIAILVEILGDDCVPAPAVPFTQMG